MAIVSQPALRQLIQRHYLQQSGTQATTWPTSGAGTNLVTIPTSAATLTTAGAFFPGTAVIDDFDGDPQWRGGHSGPNTLIIGDGVERTIILPDGTIIAVTKDGSFTINDKDAKVTYRANRVRNFNTFLNASDKLESFIKFCGEAGVKQGEMLDIPVKHFIAWLIVEAARADGEQPSIALPDLRATKPKCVSCGRFMSPKLIAKKVAVCRPICLERQLEAA